MDSLATGRSNVVQRLLDAGCDAAELTIGGTRDSLTWHAKAFVGDDWYELTTTPELAGVMHMADYLVTNILYALRVPLMKRREASDSHRIPTMSEMNDMSMEFDRAYQAARAEMWQRWHEMIRRSGVG